MEAVSYPQEVLQYLQSGVKRPVSVTAERPYSVIVKYEDGIVKKYDMQHELYGVMSFLTDYNAFQKVYIDETNSIAWDDSLGNHIDTSADTVYIYGESMV